MKPLSRHEFEKAEHAPWQLAYWRLLPPELESQYEATLAPERNRHLQFALALGVSCLLVGLMTDYAVSPEVFERALVLKSLHAALSIAAIYLLSRQAPVAVQEAAVLLVNGLAVVFQVLCSSVVPGELGTLYFLMAAIYALSINFVCAFRLGQALRSAATTSAAYAGTVYLVGGEAITHGSPVVGIIYLFGVASFITVVVPLQHERYRRKVFLSELRVEQANARLGELLRRDALTGVFNRRAFDEELGRRVAAAQGSASSVGLLMLDVDYFKVYNDKLGHQAGDECLQRVAACLAGNVRPGDVVCRYGGEEFVILLEGAGADGVSAAGERVRAAIEAMALPHPRETGATVTISVGGIAMVPSQSERGEILVRFADEALYTSKRNGRNRVTCFDKPGAALMAVVKPGAGSSITSSAAA